MSVNRVILALFIFSIFSVGITLAAKPPSNLPGTPVTMEVDPGSSSYLDSTLSGVPAGYDVTNGVYPGWCVDKGTAIYEETSYSVDLISTYDGDILDTPAIIDDPDWDLVNWMINNRAGYTATEVQEAIWYLIGGGAVPTGNALTLYNAAVASGEGYVPPVGNIYGVLCYAGEGVQDTFIEVTVLPLVPLALGGAFAVGTPLAIIGLMRRRG
jgi:hypothetical protein